MNENQCTRCAEPLTKTFAPFKNLSYCEMCEPNKKDEISDYLKTMPRGGGGGSGIKSRDL